MAGFIMTLDSDDDAPRSPSPPPAESLAGSRTTPAAAAAEPPKKQKQTKKQRMKQKKAALPEANIEDDAQDPQHGARGGAALPDDDAKMASGFVFDGLGGGFVGRDRHSVWVRIPDHRITLTPS